MVSQLTCSYWYSPVFNISSQVRSKGDSDTSCCLPAKEAVRARLPRSICQHLRQESGLRVEHTPFRTGQKTRRRNSLICGRQLKKDY
jgi:hypothetical protein